MEISTPQMLTSTQVVELIFLVRLSVTSRMALSCNDSKDPDKYDLVRVDNNCFAFIYLDHSYNQALSFCQDVGGHLADIDSVTERHLGNFSVEVKMKKKDFWIGLVYVNPLKRWVWINGAKFSYKERFEEDWWGNCMVWIIGEKKWDNIDCSKQKPFICKRAMILDSPNCNVEKDKSTTEISTRVTQYTAIPVTKFTDYPQGSTTSTRATKDWNISRLTTDRITRVSTQDTGTPQTGEPANTEEPQTGDGGNHTAQMMAGSIEMKTLLVILSGLLSTSVLVNLIFLVKYCCRCCIRAKQRKTKQSEFPLNDMAIPSASVQRLVPDPPSARSNAMVKGSEPIDIPYNEDSDQTCHYVQMDSPVLKNNTGVEGFKTDSFNHQDIGECIDGYERRNSKVIMRSPISIYNQGVYENYDGQDSKGTGQEMTQTDNQCVIADPIPSVTDNFYDTPVSPKMEKASLVTSDTGKGNALPEMDDSPKNNIGEEEFKIDSSNDHDIYKFEDGYVRRESEVVMIENIIYNQDVLDCSNTNGTGQGMTQTDIPYVMAKPISTDKFEDGYIRRESEVVMMENIIYNQDVLDCSNTNGTGQGMTQTDIPYVMAKPISTDKFEDGNIRRESEVVMMENIIYNQNVLDCSNTNGTGQEMTQTDIPYVMAKPISSDKENFYDVPVTPMDKVSLATSDTGKGNTSPEVHGIFSNSGLLESNYYSETPVASKNDYSNLKLPMVDQEEENIYANTEI